MRMIKDAQSTQSNKFAISLLYLKKELRNGVQFLHADKYQSFYKMASSFFMEVARHVQSTQNKRLVIFLQYITKKVSQLLLCSIVMQNIQNFRGFQSSSLLAAYCMFPSIFLSCFFAYFHVNSLFFYSIKKTYWISDLIEISHFTRFINVFHIIIINFVISIKIIMYFFLSKK